MKSLRHDLAGFGWLSAGALGIGLWCNRWRAQPLPWRYTSPAARLEQAAARASAARTSPAAATWRTVELAEFQEAALTRHGLCIDARPAAFYREGHVPGAMNLPREDFEKSFGALRATLEAGRGGAVFVYCAEADCQDSELVAGALVRLGWTNLLVYKGGWEEWQRAGLPREPAQP